MDMVNSYFYGNFFESFEFYCMHDIEGGSKK